MENFKTTTENKTEQPKFNNLITDKEATIKKMIDLDARVDMKKTEEEKEEARERMIEWYERMNKREGRDTNSIKDALLKWEEEKVKMEKLQREEPKEYEYEKNRQVSVATIYGFGGWHRYFVLRDGTVVYSKSHGEDDAHKAVELGFKVW